jgi:predicted lipoprotein with Yx(FWY)xxD motif
MRFTGTALTVGVLAVALSACGSSTSTSSSSTQSKSTSSSSSSAATSSTSTATPTISTYNAPGYGEIVSSAAGQTYYMFTADSATHSACNGACTSTWVPVLGTTAKVSGHAKKSLVGYIMRTNGQAQLTYDHHPLYTFTSDTSAHLVSGQGINAFGGYWYVLSPSGTAITKTSASSSSSYSY